MRSPSSIGPYDREGAVENGHLYPGLLALLPAEGSTKPTLPRGMNSHPCARYESNDEIDGVSYCVCGWAECAHATKEGQ